MKAVHRGPSLRTVICNGICKWNIFGLPNIGFGMVSRWQCLWHGCQMWCLLNTWRCLLNIYGSMYLPYLVKLRNCFVMQFKVLEQKSFFFQITPLVHSNEIVDFEVFTSWPRGRVATWLQNFFLVYLPFWPRGSIAATPKKTLTPIVCNP